MAYAALTSLAGVIDQILPKDEKYASICSKDQMNSLREKVSLLQEFLEYISLKSSLPEDIDIFESRIRDTAYKMEDTIELVILTEPGEESESDVQIPTPDGFSSCFEQVSVLLEEATEMKRIIDNNANLETHHPLTTATSSRAGSGQRYLNSTTVVGLDDALSRILDQLTGQDTVLRIILITGMGGIGKTYLASASFESPLTRQHFDLRFCVTVSLKYNIQDIFRGLRPETERTTHSDEQLIEYVYKTLFLRRYLIVLDDMWDEEVWDRVRIAFPDNNNGSRIILTTRQSGLASYIGSLSHVHEMQFLKEDQSWDLLRENVYGDEHCSTEFEGIGRKIARNCKGLPLALVVIAGLLKFNKTIDYWKQVAQNTNEKAMKSDDHFFEILCWSYTRLPPQLKACLLYMGTYTEDYEIPTKELVRLWVAEGFLKPKPDRSMEEVAEECLDELVKRSLVLVTTRRYNGKIKTCSVHDFIRGVSVRKAKEENFHYHATSPVDDESIGGVLDVQRRVSVTKCCRHTFRLPRDTFFVTTHSLIDQSIYGSVSMSIVERFKLLRVLNKVCIEESQLRILCKRTNLRYLHFVYNESGGRRIRVPQSISKLQNLETLIVSDPPIIVPESTSKRGTLLLNPIRSEYPIIVICPHEIWELQRMRHIVMLGKRIWLQVPVPNQDCPSIRTLSGVMNFNITRSLSERIPNLKILKLIYKNVIQEYSMESLQYLDQLEVLCIRSMDRIKLTNFVFPRNLRKLTLSWTNIPLKNMSSIGLLPNLKVLKLKSKSVSEWESFKEEFLRLEHLKMENLDIEHWRADCDHFPSLQKLVILDSEELYEVPESIGEIETLEKLILQADKESLRRSVKHIQKSQQELGNDLLEVIILNPVL